MRLHTATCVRILRQRKAMCAEAQQLEPTRRSAHQDRHARPVQATSRGRPSRMRSCVACASPGRISAERSRTRRWPRPDRRAAYPSGCARRMPSPTVQPWRERIRMTRPRNRSRALVPRRLQTLKRASAPLTQDDLWKIAMSFDANKKTIDLKNICKKNIWIHLMSAHGCIDFESKQFFK